MKESLKGFLLDLVGVSPMFQAVWGIGYVGVKDRAKTQNVDLGFFSEDNGYTEEDLSKITSLEIGQAVLLDDSHSAVRIR
jgi:hypothetical protein